MKASQLHQMNAEELENELQSLKKGLFQMKVRSQTERVENTAEFRSIKRDIARVKTVLKIKSKNSKPGEGA